MKVLTHVIALAVSLGIVTALSSCGKNEYTKKEEVQGDAVREAVTGTWASRCVSNRVVTLVFDADKVTLTRNDYLDADCTDLNRSTVQSAKFTPTSTYKEGVLNWLAFDPDQQVTLLLFKSADVAQVYSSTVQARNQNEQLIPPNTDDATRDTIRKENSRIRAVKAVTDWNVGEAKTLSRLQDEELDSKFGLQSYPPFGFTQLNMLQYVVDGNILYFPNGGGSRGDFGPIFERK